MGELDGGGECGDGEVVGAGLDGGLIAVGEDGVDAGGVEFFLLWWMLVGVSRDKGKDER